MKKFISTILCFVLVFAFASSALAGAVNKVVKKDGDTTLATSTTRSTTSFQALIYGSSDFGTNPSTVGVNIRVYRYTVRYTYDMTFYASDIAGSGGTPLKTKPYIGGLTTGTFTATSNLKTNRTGPVTFSGFLYF